MQLRARMLAGSIVIGAVACASTLVERRDYILAHPHGWVELSLDDRAVPQVPESSDEPSSLVRPGTCYVDVSLDHEPFVNGTAYPVGEAAPYTADSGFRFPAPIGPALLTVEYGGCDVEDGKATTVSAQLYVGVEENRVVEVHFDGTALLADPPRDDTVVTLDDVYQAVTGRKKGAP